MVLYVPLVATPPMSRRVAIFGYFRAWRAPNRFMFHLWLPGRTKISGSPSAIKTTAIRACLLWISFVHSAANPADALSRGDFTALLARGARRLKFMFPSVATRAH